MRKKALILFLIIGLFICSCGNTEISADTSVPVESVKEYLVSESSGTEEKQMSEELAKPSEIEGKSFFLQTAFYKPKYVIKEFEECYGENLFWIRALPKKIVLNDGRTMMLTYDENKWLTDIMIDEEPIYHFAWEFDSYTGKVNLRGLVNNGVSITYRDRFVTTNPWRGDTLYQPDYFQTEGIPDAFYYHLTPGEDFLIDEIHYRSKIVAKIEYTDNCPILIFTEDGEKLSDSEKETIGNNCRFLDGAVYIQELEAFYHPNRFWIDAKSGKRLDHEVDYGEESYVPLEFQDREEKGDEVWSVESTEFHSLDEVTQLKPPIILSKKLSDGRLVEFIYGDNENRILIQKNIDGQCISKYRWFYDYQGKDHLSGMNTNGVQVEYIYSAEVSLHYIRYNYYGFRYNNQIYQCYYYHREGLAPSGEEYMSIYCGDEEIVCYDRKGNVLRGTPLPEEVDPLLKAPETPPGKIYIKELNAFY